MSAYPPTPNMGLILPIPGTTEGPEYATENTEAFRTIDEHDHTSGNGARVPTAGLNIDADLSMGSNELVDVAAVELESADGTSSFQNRMNNVAGDMYWNNGSGVPVRITNGNQLDASSIGGITGMGGTDASVVYSSLDGSFTFNQDSDTLGDITAGSIKANFTDTGPIIIRIDGAAPHGVFLSGPPDMTDDVSYTLPPARPTNVTQYLVMSTNGEMTTQQSATYGLSGSSSGAFNTTSATFVTVTGVSVAFSCTGRPVLLACIPDGSGNSAFFQATDTTLDRNMVAVGQAQIKITSGVNNGATIGPVSWGTNITADASLSGVFGNANTPPGAIQFFYLPPSAGSSTFQLEVRCVSPADEVNVNYVKLLVREI